jgi:hypothetical protein
LKSYFFTIFIYLNLFPCLDSYAQDALQDKQLVIEKNRVLQLPKATQLQNRMRKVETPPSNTEQNYNLEKKQAILPILKIQVSPFVLQKTEITTEKTHNNFLKIGFGNYSTLFGEAFLQLPKNEKYNLSFTAKHLSSATGSVLEEKSGNNRTNIGLQGSYKITENSETFGQLSYNQVGVHYYGANSLILKDLDIEKIKQTYRTFDVSAGYRKLNTNQNANISYQAQINYYNFSSKTEVSENALNLTGNTKIKFTEDANLSIGLGANFANRNDNNQSISRNLLIISPNYQLNIDKLQFVVGANLVYDNDTIRNSNNFRFYPNLQITYNISQQIKIYGIFTGTTQKTSLRDFVHQNPFLGNQITLTHTNKQWEIIAGIEGRISQIIGYKLKSSYATYKNLYFFNNSSTDSTKFAVLYDTEGTKLFSAIAEVYAQFDNLKAGFKSELFAYNTESITKAWHRPNFVNTLTINYLYKQKLSISTEIFNQNGLKGYNFISKKEYNLATIFDVNLQASYLLGNNISVFLKLNNIFSQQYQQYLYYDTQRFNALIGAMWKF